MVYLENQRSVVREIFWRKCARVRYYTLQEIFGELAFAIRHEFIAREHVHEIFTTVWPIFSDRKLEQLLFPLARVFAWTLCIDDRETDAIAFLENIWDQKLPFKFSNPPEGFQLINGRRWQPNLPIVGGLLYDLTTIERDRETIAAEITRLEELGITLDQCKYTVMITRTGIIMRGHYDDNYGLSFPVFDPPRLPFRPKSTPQ